MFLVGNISLESVRNNGNDLVSLHWMMREKGVYSMVPSGQSVVVNYTFSHTSVTQGLDV